MLICDHDTIDAGLTLPELLQHAEADGITLRLTNAGRLIVDGDAAALLRWLPAIRARRHEILLAIERPPQWCYETKGLS